MANATAAGLGRRAASARSSPPGWDAFRRNLDTALATLANQQFLVISTKRGNRFVQFARGPVENGTSELRVETVSNEYLPEDGQLTKKQLADLAELGWTAPTHPHKGPTVAHGSPNFFTDFEEPFPCDRVAQLCVETLRGVHRVRSPRALEYRSFQEPGGVDVFLPGLGIDKAAEAKRPAVPPEQTWEEARAAVLEAVRNASRKPDLSYDKDGDIEVDYGEATLFVHVTDTPRFVRVYSPVATNISVDESLLQRLNDLNGAATFVRFLVVNGIVWASTEVFAHPLLPKHVIHACHVVGDVSNDLREPLKREFGERTVVPMPTPGAFKN